MRPGTHTCSPRPQVRADDKLELWSSSPESRGGIGSNQLYLVVDWFSRTPFSPRIVRQRVPARRTKCWFIRKTWLTHTHTHTALHPDSRLRADSWSRPATALPTDICARQRPRCFRGRRFADASFSRLASISCHNSASILAYRCCSEVWATSTRRRRESESHLQWRIPAG